MGREFQGANPLNRMMHGRVLVQGPVGSGSVIVARVRRTQYAARARDFEKTTPFENMP